MTFEQLLEESIRKAGVKTKAGPGGEEAIAARVLALVKAWVKLHIPESHKTPFDAGCLALANELLAELDGLSDVQCE